MESFSVHIQHPYRDHRQLPSQFESLRSDGSNSSTNYWDLTVAQKNLHSYVKYLGEMTPDGQDVVKTVVLDEAASTSISQIIKTQKYDIEDASFPVDLVFIVDGQSYHMNSQSGQIFGINGVSAVLSEEALQEVLSLLANE